MVAAAPSLPNIPAEQIARDIVSQTNPRTGQRELIAAPFDPFEEDPALAGSLRLRSAGGATAIDGYALQDGALVEVDFYYNSPSDDPYGGRNYGEVAFVNGDLAPVVKRDTRIIECSTRVENVVYDHVSYYDTRYSRGLYRPHRFYSGHSAFGFGFGSGYFGPGYGLFSSSRIGFNANSFGGRGFNRSRSFGSRSGAVRRSNRHSRRVHSDRYRHRNETDRHRDRDEARRSRNRDETRRSRDQDETRRSRRDRDREEANTRNREDSRRQRNVRRLTDREIDARARRVQSFGLGRNRADVRRNARQSGVGSPANARPRIGVAPAARAPAAQAPAATPSNNAATRQSQPRRNAQTRSETRTTPTRRDTRRSETRRDSSNSRSNSRSSSNRASSRRANSRSDRVKKSAPRRRISPNSIKRRLNFFPTSSHGGRNVVTSQTVDCAREDKLTVFIPNARLDAARFDGLTIIALDAQGGEAPIYLPPNYIEGFQLASTGRVRPRAQPVRPQVGSPFNVPPSFPQYNQETAPCPAGTSKQQDGTCLQTNGIGYPQ